MLLHFLSLYPRVRSFLFPYCVHMLLTILCSLTRATAYGNAGGALCKGAQLRGKRRNADGILHIRHSPGRPFTVLWSDTHQKEGLPFIYTREEHFYLSPLYRGCQFSLNRWVSSLFCVFTNYCYINILLTSSCFQIWAVTAWQYRS